MINVGTLEAAELVKLAGMVYRDVNIALVNELARYAESVGVDFESIRAAANTDGEAALLVPGIGVGGHCTPVYPHFLIQDAAERGTSLRIAEAARAVNEYQPIHMLNRAGPLAGKRVLILGLGFRPGVKEPTCSPAFALRDEIVRRGGEAAVHDPLFSDEELTALGFTPARLESADVIVLNTAHDVFRDLDWNDLGRAGTRQVIDGRNIWHTPAVTESGLTYIGVGKPTAVPQASPPAA
jgi:nucleotide sugar dehydrogenase